jgi:hypothetical protein
VTTAKITGGLFDCIECDEKYSRLLEAAGSNKDSWAATGSFWNRSVLSKEKFPIRPFPKKMISERLNATAAAQRVMSDLIFSSLSFNKNLISFLVSVNKDQTPCHNLNMLKQLK